MVTRTVEDYLVLPYTIEVQRDSTDGYTGFVARIVELPGCMTQADTFEELEEMVQDAMRAWIETAIEDNLPIPEPRPIEEYSGKFVVRIPKSLHRELFQLADRENVSLNSLIGIALARYVGRESESRTDLKQPNPDSISRVALH